MKSLFYFGAVLGVIVVSAFTFSFVNAQIATSIYEDSVLAPWSPGSFKGVYDYANTVKVFHGSASVYAYASSSGGVSFSTQGVPQSLAGQGYFQFSAFSRTSFRITPVLRSGTKIFRSSVIPVLPANQWTTFSIPLSKFSGLATNTIDRVDIQNDALPRAWYLDSVGFTSAAVGVTSTLPDKTAPTVSLAGVTQGASVAGIVPLSVTASDNIGVSQTQIKIDGGIRVTASLSPDVLSYSWDTGKMTNGPHTLQVVAFDASGNTALSVPVTVLVQNPVPVLLNAFPLVVYTDAVNSPWVASSSRATVDMQSSPVVYRGTSAIHVNSLSSGKLIFSTVSSVNATPYRYLEFAVYSATATQPVYAGLRVNGRIFSLPAVTTNPGSWKYVSLPVTSIITTSSPSFDYLEFRSDALAREWDIDEIRLVSTSTVYDSEAPAVSLAFPQPGNMVSGTVVFSATASDNVGVKGVQFKVDGVRVGAEDLTAPYSVVWNTLNVVRGTHTLWAEARDAAGNKNTSAIVNFTVTAIPDVLSPTTPVGLIARAISTSQIDLSWSAARDNISVSGYRIYRDGGSPRTVTSTRYSDMNLAASTTYSYQISAFDPTGNESVKSLTVSARTTNAASTSDPVFPTVSLTSPVAGTSVSGFVTVRASAYDNVGVAGVQFQLDGANLGSEDLVSPYEISWNTNGVTNGSHELKAVVRDAAGNRVVSARTIVTVSNGTIGGGSASSSFKSVVWYDVWSYDQYPPTRMQFNGIKQLVIFGGDTTGITPNVNVYPYFPPADYNSFAYRSTFHGDGWANLQKYIPTSTQTWMQFFRQKANENGIELYLDLGGEYGTPAAAFNALLNDRTKWDAYINAVDEVTQRNPDGVKFDGISFDIEWLGSSVQDRQNFADFLAAFRAKLDTWSKPGKIGIATGMWYLWSNNPTTPYIASSTVNRYLDWMFIMGYNTYNSTKLGFEAQLYQHPLINGVEVWNDRATTQFTANGVEAQRVVLGTSGEILKQTIVGAATPGGPASNSTTGSGSGSVVNQIFDTAILDPIAKAAYAVAGNTWYSFETPASVNEKIKLVQQYNLGGIGYYSTFASGDGNGGSAVNKSLNAYQNGVQAVINKVSTSTIDTLSPSVPTGLTATPVSSSQINLSWTASTDNVAVTGYRIYRGGTQVGTSITTGYQDTGLAASTTYLYTVLAYDAAGNSSLQSAGASGTTFGSTSSATSSFAVLGYYADWDLMDGYTPERIDFSVVTHAIHFAENATTGYPYFIPTSRIEGTPYTNPITGQLVPSVQKGLIDAAHTAHKKALLGIAQVAYYNTPPALSQIFSDSSKTDTFVNQIINYIKLKGYDGVDINWEYPSASDRVNFSAFLVKMRTALDTMTPHGTLTITVDNGAIDPLNRGVDVSTLNSSVDYVIIESISRLTGAGNVYSGIPNALYHPACTPFDAHTLADSFSPRMNAYVTNNGWAQIGVEKQRATMYMPTYFEWFSGVDGPCQPAAGVVNHTYIPMSLGEVLRKYSATSTLVTDSTAKAKYFTFTDSANGKNLVTYWDEETTTDFINLLKSRGFSSVVLYDLGLAYVGPNNMPNFSKPRDYILKAIGAAINGVTSTVSVADALAPSVPTGLTATPVSSSQINLSWTASTDNVAVTGYRVYRNGTQLSTVTTPLYQNTGLATGTTYLYTVAAYDATGNVSGQSVGVSVTTLSGIIPTSTPTSTPASTPTSTLFHVGDRVRTTAALNVRATPSASGTLLGTQPLGIFGTVIGGAVAAGGYQWWNVNYDSGVDGWSAENWLVSATTTVILPPTTTSTLMSLGYYTLWSVCDMTPADIDYSALTHIVHFNTSPRTTFPYTNVLDASSTLEYGVPGWCDSRTRGVPEGWQQQMINLGHNKGVKTLLSMGGEWGDHAVSMDKIVSNTAGTSSMKIFVDTLLDYAKRRNYDGVEVNWEFPGSNSDKWENVLQADGVTNVWTRTYTHQATQQHISDFLNYLRQGIDSRWGVGKGTLAVTVGSYTNSLYDPVVLNRTADILPVMNYGMGAASYSGFNAPIYRPTAYANYNADYITKSTTFASQGWVNFGIDKSKVLLLMSFEDIKWSKVTGPGQSGGSAGSWISYSNALQERINNSANYFWDDVAKASWVGGGTLFQTFEDTKSIQEKVKYAKSIGIGGIGAYDLWRGWLPSGMTDPDQPGKRDPLLQALKQALGR